MKLALSAALGFVAMHAIGCAAPAPAGPSSPRPIATAHVASTAAATSAPVAAAPRLEPPAPATATASASAAPPPAPEPTGTFPPPPFAAPVARTAKPGDGTWTPIAGTEDARGPALYRTTIHPDRIKGWVEVTLVAIDRSRVDLHLVAGTVEPLSRDVPAEHRTGLVPEADRPGLLAVFNGGFMARHGGFGMRVGADRFLAPREDACTVALASDGSVRVAPWKEIAPSEPSLAAWRQTPPCLVTDGRASEDLVKYPKRFGGAENGDHEIRRSALGLDATGRTLFYAHGEWTTAEALGAALAAAGVANAAELDINWSYTKFLFYRHAEDGSPEVADALVPKTEYGKRRYIEKPAERDFFYLVRHSR